MSTTIGRRNTCPLLFCHEDDTTTTTTTIDGGVIFDCSLYSVSLNLFAAQRERWKQLVFSESISSFDQNATTSSMKLWSYRQTFRQPLTSRFLLSCVNRPNGEDNVENVPNKNNPWLALPSFPDDCFVSDNVTLSEDLPHDTKPSFVGPQFMSRQHFFPIKVTTADFNTADFNTADLNTDDFSTEDFSTEDFSTEDFRILNTRERSWTDATNSVDVVKSCRHKFSSYNKTMGLIIPEKISKSSYAADIRTGRTETRTQSSSSDSLNRRSSNDTSTIPCNSLLLEEFHFLETSLWETQGSVLSKGMKRSAGRVTGRRATGGASFERKSNRKKIGNKSDLHQTCEKFEIPRSRAYEELPNAQLC